MLVETEDDGVLLASQSFSYPIEGVECMLIWKIDANGQIVWQKVLNAISMDDAIATKDGGYLLTGLIYVESGESAVLYKIDSIGNVVWQTFYGSRYGTGPNAYYDCPWNMKQIGDYFYITTSVNFGSYLHGRIYKVDANGKVIWQLSNNADEQIMEKKINSVFAFNGHFYFNQNTEGLFEFDPETGEFWSLSDDLDLRGLRSAYNFGVKCDVLTELVRESSDTFYLRQLDEINNVFNDKLLQGVYDNSLAVYSEAKDGGHLILSGNTDTLQLTKTDCLGNVEFWSGECNSKITPENNISLYPNPTSNFLNVEVKFEINYIVCYNALGQIVKINNDCTCKTQRIDLSKFSAGVYRIKVVGIDFEATSTFVKI